MGKLHGDQRDAIRELVDAGMSNHDIAREVTQRTGRPTTAPQVNGYRNVLTGVANGPKDPAAAASVHRGFETPAANKTPSPGASAGAGASEDGFTSMAGGLDEFAATQDPATVWYDVYRDEPANGYVGRMAVFTIQLLAEKFGQGLYRVDKFYNGRLIGRRDKLRISVGGPPKFEDGRLAAPHMAAQGRPYLEPSPYGYNPYNPYGYQQQGYGPTPVQQQDPTQQFRNIAAVANDMAARMMPPANAADQGTGAFRESLAFANQVMANQNQQGGGSNSFIQTFLATQQTQFTQQLQAEREKRDTERAAEKEARIAETARLKQEAADRLELERERARIAEEGRTKEYERQKERDREYYTNLMAIHTKKAEDVAEMKDGIAGQIAALQTELEDKARIAKEHYDGLYQLQKQGLADQKAMQDELFNERKKALESQRTDGLLARTIDNGLNRLGTSFDRVATLRAVKELPAGERTVLLNALAGLNGNGNGHALGNGNGSNGNGSTNGNGHKEDAVVDSPGGGGDFRQAAIDKVLSSDFFKTLQDEWATYIDAGPDFGPEPFVVMFMQWVQKSPNMATFAAYMIPRPWKVIHDLMRPKLSVRAAETFAKPDAEKFYEMFRRLLNANLKVVAQMALRMQQAQQQPAPSTSPV